MEVERISGCRAMSLTALTLRARRRIFVAEREVMPAQGTFACRARTIATSQAPSSSWPSSSCW